ncbi:MAG: biopolymer transporter ExbD [Anaeromyxobacter sp.]|nr:biopolymer transporter ExbD [Anaeromyxobacter sp.]MBL0275335.1 biopolymer transporter ExbD [Anaeromyxobacter sp.]
MGMALGTKKPTSDINVTPLIDVVLVLLIIFMVLTPLAEKQKYTRVPEYQPEAQPVPPDSVPPDQTVLTALPNGMVLLNKQLMTLEQAAVKLEPNYDGRPSKVLFFNADDKTHYGVAMAALDMAHGAGVNTIGLMTDPPLVTAEAPADGAPAEAPPPTP